MEEFARLFLSSSGKGSKSCRQERCQDLPGLPVELRSRDGSGGSSSGGQQLRVHGELGCSGGIQRGCLGTAKSPHLAECLGCALMESVPGWLRHAVLGSLHTPGQCLAQGCVLRKQKSLAELQEQISSLVIG